MSTPIDLEAALRLADEAERVASTADPMSATEFYDRVVLCRRNVPALASTVRGLVERVRELEDQASMDGVFLTAARCSYQVAKSERDYAVFALEKRHLGDGDSDIELPNGRRIEAGWDDGPQRIWGFTEGHDRKDYPTLLEAICAGMGKISGESTNG